MPNYLIIGASAAGLSCAQRLRELDPDATITVLSEDMRIYSRCMLHKVLSGERRDDSLDFTDPDFFIRNQITWRGGARVERVKEQDRLVVLEDGSELPYDRLLVASGAESMLPPVANLADANNIYGFRTLDDLHQLRQAVQGGAKRIAIIGAGLVGMDVAYGLCQIGCTPVVVEREPRILPLQTDSFAAQVYQRLFEAHGCEFYLGTAAESAELNGNRDTEALILQDGTRIPCDTVVAAVSVRPSLDFLRGTSVQSMFMNYYIQTVLNTYLRKSNLQVNKGLSVNEHLQTSSPDIFAAGDVTGVAAIWPEAKAMGRCAASNMAGRPEAYPTPFPYQNTSSFWGLTMASLGRLDIDESAYRVLTHHDGRNYKKLVLRNGCLIGALMLGDLRNTGVYRRLIYEGIPVDHFSERELFTLSFADFYGIDPRTGAYQYRQ